MLKRGLISLTGLLALWQLVVSAAHLPSYILPSPWLVMKTWWTLHQLILQQTWPTLVEIICGLILGSLIGISTALLMGYFKPARLWLMPALLVSQAIPTFAIAPLLVVWLGYGMASKIVTTMIMLFFPVTSALLDGLRRTPSDWHDLAKTMNASPWRTLLHIQLPAALPALASGLRVATAIAPIGAVAGEWVGSSRGLGFLMLNANGRMQIDLMFAALFTLVIISLLLYYSVDKLLRIAIPWQPES